LADSLNLYKILGLKRTATTNQIKQAYRRLVMKHHPDRGGDAEDFKPIQEAHDVLMDKEKRAYYDEHGKPPPKGPDILGMAFNVLKNWFIACGNNYQWDKGPYVRDIRNQCATQLNSLENQLESINQTLERVQVLIMKTSGEENPLQTALDQVRKKLEKDKKQAELGLLVHSKIEELMKPYTDDYVEPQQMANVFIVHTNSTTGSSTGW